MRRVIVIVALLSLGHLPSAAQSNGAVPGLPPGSAAVALDGVQARGDSDPPPMGACCDLTTGECVIMSQPMCEAQPHPHHYLGDHTLCMPNPCPPSAVDGGVPNRPTGLLGAVPNPFRETTSIRYFVSQAGRGRLEIFDPAGRLVQTLATRDLAAGFGVVTWDGQTDQGLMAAPGVYFCRFSHARGRDAKTLILIE